MLLAIPLAVVLLAIPLGVLSLPIPLAVLSLAIPLAITVVFRVGASLVLVLIFFAIVEHALRVVLDAQNLMTLELFAAGEVVISRLELEVHEIGFGDEPGRGNGCRAGWRGRVVRRRWLGRVGSTFLLVRGLRVLPLEPLALAACPRLLVLFSRLVADGDAVEADRAADVETIADIPRVFPLLPIDRHPGRTQHFELLAFIEYVPARASGG